MNRRGRTLVAGAAVALVLLAACSSGSSLQRADDVAVTGPTFEGDVGSPFCQRSRTHARSPAEDPFAPDLRADQIELRIRLLRDRIEALDAVAPDVLATDIATLRDGFDRLVVALDAVDYDLARLAGSDADLSVVDDPRFAAISERLVAYQRQVCLIAA